MAVTRQSNDTAIRRKSIIRERRIEPNKHQIRTEQTWRKLLRSALKIFARDGFEAARLEEIAKDAGYTRGAFYAHFESKEDLFLALLEQQIACHLGRVKELTESAGCMRMDLAVLREYYLSKVKDQNWAMLMLELKLFAARHPRLRASLAARHRAIRERFKLKSLVGARTDTPHTPQIGQDALRGMLEAVLHSFVLQRAYDPQIFSQEEAVAALGMIFDRLTEAK